MFYPRKSAERGSFNHGWLDTKHTFSFASYHDPRHMGFGPLRVINEDKVEAGEGFGLHYHQEMEIITYVLSGALEHKDTIGNQSTILPGEVQRMSAGTGIGHSEYNHHREKGKDVHLLQIWIHPGVKALPPSYEQKDFNKELRAGVLVLVASKDGREGSVLIHQDLDLYACRFPPEADEEGDSTFPFHIRPQGAAWVQVVKGRLSVNNYLLEAGDGLGIIEERDLLFQLDGSHGPCEFLLFEMNHDWK